MRFWRYSFRLALLCAVLLGGYFLGRARAQQTQVVPLVYSGLILKNGVPLADETADIRLTLFAPGASTAACKETSAPQTELQAGHFQVFLHDSCVEPITNTRNLLVHLEINGEELEPRALGAVPYALYADKANDARTLDGESAAHFAPADHTHVSTNTDGGAPSFDSISTGSSLAYHLLTLKVGGDLASDVCSTESCPITGQSGSVDSVERRAAGSYWVTFKDRTFAAAPTCSCNPFQGNPGRGCTAVTPDKDGLGVHTYWPGNEQDELRDFAFELICVGPAAEAQ